MVAYRYIPCIQISSVSNYIITTTEKYPVCQSSANILCGSLPVAVCVDPNHNSDL